MARARVTRIDAQDGGSNFREAGKRSEFLSETKPSPEIMEATRTALGALLAYRRDDMRGLDELVDEYSRNPRPLTTALFHLANILAEKSAQAEGRSGDELLKEFAEKMAASTR